MVGVSDRTVDQTFGQSDHRPQHSGENGSGHGDVFKGLDGKYRYVYHVHNSDKTVAPRKTRIVPLEMRKENGFSI